MLIYATLCFQPTTEIELEPKMNPNYDSGKQKDKCCPYCMDMNTTTVQPPPTTTPVCYDECSDTFYSVSELFWY